jgi:hypothetical protein
MPTQDRLNIFLKVLTEFTYFLLYIFPGFGLRHSDFTCLSKTKKALWGANHFVPGPRANRVLTTKKPVDIYTGRHVGCLQTTAHPRMNTTYAA